LQSLFFSERDLREIPVSACLAQMVKTGNYQHNAVNAAEFLEFNITELQKILKIRLK
jgi:hypothetical protein